ncbi:aminotransferase class I/II-fold pyridoxal phosphate-dependent enzyme [Magnetospirillum sp. 64-120]|uniref:pyridoxal phosphate-dependent aminotransferase n=1 Tax=Magnetospirillum sp. 64-120 TaxID=1895778 RepID=UPI00092A49CF|nr:aminotransferase class I/II-fold pyridoxal phosphate-dependent enzyme [Magnetospirillum sp. 64-120]OJX80852.1 MAG: 1-aminocyclopropane-1-carboxylate deaminase [Magnetospirillum sp. 64-120]
MAFKVAARGAISPFIVMDVMRAANERAAQGGDVVHLEVGQPSGQAPSRVLAAARAALDCDPIGYTEAFGLPILREKIAGHYRHAYGVSVDPARIAVTTGSSAGFLLAFVAAFEPGDRVAVAAPGYPAYRNILTALGVECVLVPVGPQSRYQLTVEVLQKVEGRLDGVVVASPSNPTGSMLNQVEVAALSAWCETNGVRLISDEIYHGITYGAPAATALGQADHGVIVNSFSKYYAMTGWRLGWLVLPDDLLRSVECLQQNLFISAPTLSQLAAAAVFDSYEELDARVAGYARNRDILLNELPKAGFRKLAPSDGAFYLYADIAELTNDSADFCRRMLAETGVATTPGVDFDPLAGAHTMRFSFAGSAEDMVKAADRLRGWRK